jgi:hypothetical protein
MLEEAYDFKIAIFKNIPHCSITITQRGSSNRISAIVRKDVYNACGCTDELCITIRPLRPRMNRGVFELSQKSV